MSNCCCCWALFLVHFEATAATPGGRVAKLASARSVLGSGMGNGNGESRRTSSLSFYDVLHHFGCSRSTVHSMQSNKIKTYFKIFSGTFSLSLPFCLSSFRFWFRFPFRRMLCILYIYLPLLCFLHFNIHILDAFFNDLLGLSVNETVFSTST